MLYVPIPREKLLLLMPKGGRVAEIGTFRGDFSEAILKTVQPERLHLIDPWRHQDRPDYQSDGSNLSDRGHEDNFAHVRARFADAVADGTVVLHREFSPEAASAFADGSLDWVYIDGMHTLDAVRADLAAWKPKLCEGGLILGHDYIETADYGVIPAVDEFLRTEGWSMIALTAEAAATFVLADESRAGAAAELLSRIVYNVPGVIEIRGFPERPFLVRSVTFPDGTVRQFPSF